MAKEHHRHFIKSREELLREEESKRQRIKEFELSQKQKEQKKKVFIYGTIAVIILIAATISTSIYLNKNIPGKWDNFAKCLTEKGAVMYGWMAECKYTQHQAGMFGNSFKYINYKDFQTNPDVKKTPTWYINGEKLAGEQTFETLSQVAGCPIY